MTVFIGSRYETGNVVNVTDADGDTTRAVFRGESPFPTSTIVYDYYLVAAGDRLDSIAYDFFGRSDFGWVIADANQNIPLMDPLTPGIVLQVPDARDIR